MRVVKNIEKLLVFRLLVLAFVSLPCMAEGNESIKLATPEMGSVISVQMSLSEVPEINKRIRLSVIVSDLTQNVVDVEMGLIAADGIEVINEHSKKHLDVMRVGLDYTSNFDIFVRQIGQYKMTFKVIGRTLDGKFVDRYENLFFSVENESSLNKMSWKTPYLIEDEDPALNAGDFDTHSLSKGFPSSDINNNEISVNDSSDAKNSVQSIESGMVTISGRYRFRNRENDGYIGFYHSLLHLINATTNVTIASTYTDDDGNFTFPAVSNPGNEQMRVRAYAVRFLNGKGYGVCVYQSCDDNAAISTANLSQFYYRQSAAFQTADGNQNVGTFTTGFSLTNSLRAQWIKNDIDTVYRHLTSNSSILGPFTIEWAGDSTHGDHYHRGGNIHLKSDSGNGVNHTVLHELGHNVMYNSGNFPAGSDCPDPHFTSQISGTQCAWTEGWASAFILLVNNNPEKCVAPSTTNCIDFEVASSYSNCNNWDCGANADWVEGHVTGSIWDLYDSADDVFDIEVNAIDNIYTILGTQTNTSFSSWWVSWNLFGFSDRGINSLFQNAIQYSNGYDIRVISPSVTNSTPFTDEEFTAQVSVRNLEEITSISTYINFYLSENSTISNFDTPLGISQFAGDVDPNVVRLVQGQFTVANSGNYWVGACFQDALGFDTNSSNNCSSGVAITVTANDVIFASGFE